jgi:hypothetical protein
MSAPVRALTAPARPRLIASAVHLAGSTIANPRDLTDSDTFDHSHKANCGERAQRIASAAWMSIPG